MAIYDDKSECLQHFLASFPGIGPRWERWIAQWEPGTERGFCNDISQFASYVGDLVKAGQLDDLPRIFVLAEDLMANGNQDIQDAVATCFLENLQNTEVDPRAWVHLLGPESRDYCRAWDQFTGVQTPGL